MRRSTRRGPAFSPTPAGWAPSSPAAERPGTMGAGVSTAPPATWQSGSGRGPEGGKAWSADGQAHALLSGWAPCRAVRHVREEWRVLATTALAPGLLGHAYLCAPSAARRRRPIWGTWTANLSARFPAAPLAGRVGRGS